MKGIIVLGAAIALALSGCSSSSDSGNTTTGGVTYTGKTTAAVITSANATTLLSATNGSAGTGSGVAAVAPKLSQKSSVRPLGLAGQLVSQAKQALAKKPSQNVAAGVVQTQTTTIDGATDLGPGGTGTMTMVSEIDDVTGLGSVTMTANNFGVAPDLTNGTMTITVSAVDAANNPTSMSITFTDFSTTDATGTSRMGGSISLARVGNTETLTMDFVAVASTGESFKMQNFKLVSTYDTFNALLSDSISGRLYDSVSGYIDITTTNPLLYSPAGSFYPSSGGPMIITGANNAKIRMTPVNATDVTIEVDADGDGIYESTQTVAQSSL